MLVLALLGILGLDLVLDFVDWAEDRWALRHVHREPYEDQD